MKSELSHPRPMGASNDGQTLTSMKPVTAVDTANGAMESARDLSQRVVSLAQLLAGFVPPEGNSPDVATSNVFGRLRANALDANSAVALAHEALDFIEGQIS